MSEVIFRQMTAADIERVALVEKQSFTTPWSVQSFREEMENQAAYYLVALVEAEVVAYMGAWLLLDEAHITNIAVARAYRRQGIGAKLLRAMIKAVQAKGVDSLTLEVRPSNAAALALYGKFGFTQAGRRKHYYEDTHEDAVIMWLKEIGKRKMEALI